MTSFEDAAAEATQLAVDDPGAALRLLEQARRLWRGPALVDLLGDIEGLQADAARLADLLVTVDVQRLGLSVHHGDRATAVVELERIVAATDPRRETAVGHLMIGLTERAGRPTLWQCSLGPGGNSSIDWDSIRRLHCPPWSSRSCARKCRSRPPPRHPAARRSRRFISSPSAPDYRLWSLDFVGRDE